MAYWNSEKLKQRISSDRLITREDDTCFYDENRVKHCAYELAVGKNHLITGKGKPTELALEKVGDSLKIPPGQFGLLTTEEVISIPPDAIGFISIRATIKFKGLINVSGFHVDPGYKGRLKFSVYNAGARQIHLERGEIIFMLWYADLNATTEDVIKEKKEKYFKIVSQDRECMDGEVASPGQLLKDVTSLRRQIRFIQTFGAAALLLILPVFVGQFFTGEDSGRSEIPVNTTKDLVDLPTHGRGSTRPHTAPNGDNTLGPNESDEQQEPRPPQ